MIQLVFMVKTELLNRLNLEDVKKVDIQIAIMFSFA
jgi:hypothetical protein